MTHISVVIPTCNSSEWISEALDSVRAQTYRRDRLETIVVDDGSCDDSVELARAFLAKHCMRGSVLLADQGSMGNSARNRGWQAATGDWIQFLDRHETLAPSKLELQAALIADAAEDVAVVASSWQRLVLRHGVWQPVASASRPKLEEPLELGLVDHDPGFLASALVNKASLAATGGFSQDIGFAEDEHLMLKIAQVGGKFVEAPAPEPLVLLRDAGDARSLRAQAGFARQHLENTLIAAAMVRRKRLGTLTLEDDRRIGQLCEESLGVLYEHDREAFQQYWDALRKIVPDFTPRRGLPVRLASRVMGYERAEALSLSVRQGRARVLGVLAVAAASPRTGAAAVRRALQHAAATAGALSSHGAARIAQIPGSLAERARQVGGRLAALTAAIAGYRVAGAAVTLAAGAAIAAFVTSSQLGGKSGPAGPQARPRLAEAQRIEAPRTETLRTDAPRIEVTAAIAAEPGAQAAPRDRKVDVVAGAAGSGAGAEMVSPPPVKSDRAAQQATAKAPETPKTKTAAVEPGKTKTPPAPASIATKADSGSSEAARPVAPAEAKPPAASTPGPLPESPSAAQEPVRVAVAKIDQGHKDTGSRAASSETKSAPASKPEVVKEGSAPAKPAEIQTASLGRPESARASTGAAPADKAAPAAAARLDRADEAPVAAIPSATLTPEQRANAERLVARGERDLADGNIAQARQFFMRASAAGLARGALLLASTYDAEELAGLHAVGVQPNVALARRWYERARELGAPEAEARLARLGGG